MQSRFILTFTVNPSLRRLAMASHMYPSSLIGPLLDWAAGSADSRDDREATGPEGMWGADFVYRGVDWEVAGPEGV